MNILNKTFVICILFAGISSSSAKSLSLDKGFFYGTIATAAMAFVGPLFYICNNLPIDETDAKSPYTNGMSERQIQQRFDALAQEGLVKLDRYNRLDMKPRNRRVYLQASLYHHPDKRTGNHENFQELNALYEQLLLE